MDPVNHTVSPTEVYTILHQPPTPEDLSKLRRESGLTPPPTEIDLVKALANSVHTVIARTSSSPDGETIGMVRMVGDGQMFMLICDMAVLPAYQGKGIGKKLLDEMIRWIDENAPNAYVSLIGDPPGQKLYKSRGFVPTHGMGMKRSKWGG